MLAHNGRLWYVPPPRPGARHFDFQLHVGDKLGAASGTVPTGGSSAAAHAAGAAPALAASAAASAATAASNPLKVAWTRSDSDDSGADSTITVTLVVPDTAVYVQGWPTTAPTPTKRIRQRESLAGDQEAAMLRDDDPTWTQLDVGTHTAVLPAAACM